MSLYPILTLTLGGLALVAIAGGLGLLALLAHPGGRELLAGTLGGQERHPLAWAWAAAFIAMSGSLYFSDVMGFIPCMLCWYQRIAMYPLVLILAVAFLRSDPAVWRFAIPLPVVGLAISIYHVLLQYNPSVEIVACSTGVSCSARYLAVFGFVSIPTMAGAAFLLITGLLVVVRLGSQTIQDDPRRT